MNITFERRKFIEYRREHHPMFVNGEYDFDYTLGEFTLSSTQAAWEYWVASAETLRPTRKISINEQCLLFKAAYTRLKPSKDKHRFTFSEGKFCMPSVDLAWELWLESATMNAVEDI